MNGLTYVLFSIQIMILVFQIIILYKFLHSYKKEISIHPDMIIKSIIEDFTSKLTIRDEKIAELMVRLEVLEERLKVSPVKPEISKTSRLTESRKVSATNLTIKILELLNENSLTSREIQRIIRKSREHTARLLKSLYDQGFVDRDDSKKPFRYVITEKGKNFLSSTSL